MTIQLQPDQEQAIQAAISAGRFRSVDEFIESAIRTLAKPTASSIPPDTGGSSKEFDLEAAARRGREAKSVVELFAPLRGLFEDGELDFSRDPSPGRPIDLS